MGFLSVLRIRFLSCRISYDGVDGEMTENCIGIIITEN